MFETLLVALTLVQARAVPQPESVALDGTWTIEVIDNIKVMPDAPVTLTFRGNRITGTASCNSFQGNVTISGTSLKPDGILATLKACDGPLMSQERDFLTLFRNVTRYELARDGTLSLLTNDGKRLSGRRQE